MSNAKADRDREELLELRAFLDLFDRIHMATQTHPTRSQEAEVIIAARLLQQKYPRGLSPVALS